MCLPDVMPFARAELQGPSQLSACCVDPPHSLKPRPPMVPLAWDCSGRNTVQWPKLKAIYTFPGASWTTREGVPWRALPPGVASLLSHVSYPHLPVALKTQPFILNSRPGQVTPPHSIGAPFPPLLTPSSHGAQSQHPAPTCPSPAR